MCHEIKFDWSGDRSRVKCWYLLLITFILLIGHGQAKGGEESICKIETLANDVDNYLKQNFGKSSWFALDNVTTPIHIMLGQKCFEQWSRPLSRLSRGPIVRQFHTYKDWNTIPFYAPASDFGYAKVYLNDTAHKSTFSTKQFETNSIIVKESFSLDPKGFVYANPLFYMKKVPPNRWEFYSYSYLKNTITKESFCLKCHNNQKHNDYTFGNYHIN